MGCGGIEGFYLFGDHCGRVLLGDNFAERQGQRREPAAGRARIATRRAGWLPFAGPTGSTPLSCNRGGSRCSGLPMRCLISFFRQDGRMDRMALGVVVVLVHPVILLSCQI
jgi:hypothetical protein